MFYTHPDLVDTFVELKAIEQVAPGVAKLRVTIRWWNWGQEGIPYDMDVEEVREVDPDKWTEFQMMVGTPNDWIERAIDPRKDC